MASGAVIAIRSDLLDRVAEVYKAQSPGSGQFSHATESAFSWPCRAQPVSPTAQLRATGRLVHGDWRLFGDVPGGGNSIEKGDRLLLDNGLNLLVSSEAERTGPRLEYLTLTATRS